MRIGVNLHHLTPGEIGGMEMYVRSLVEWIPSLDRDVRLVLFCGDRSVTTFQPGPGVEIQHLSEADFAGLDASRLAPHELDVWFCPLLTLEPHSPGPRTVVTVPDLQHEAHPEFFGPELLEWRRQNYVRTVWEADRILTLSEASKQDLVDFYGVPEQKIVATHLDAQRSVTARSAKDTDHLTRVRTQLGLPDRYLYYPANDWPHKNHAVLFEALGRFRARGIEPPALVLSGARVDPTADWTAQLCELGLERTVRHLGLVPADQLTAIYAQADALVFPSLFEGFGIPVVEAMRSRCPVVCSDRTSLPEIAGDAVLWFDPTDVDELFEQLWAIHTDVDQPGQELRRSLIEAGRRRATRFSWRACAATTLDTIRSAAGRRTVTVIRTTDAPLPSISIITPSLNQGRFIERTIRSVLEQDHDDVRHLVIDGGSTDGTLDILERFARSHPERFEFVSEPDRGQAHAVNKGLGTVNGDIIGWINSDDLLSPGALDVVAHTFAAHPSWEITYGHAAWISEDDVPIAPYPTDSALGLASLEHDCRVCQPTVFMRRTLIDRGVALDEGLQWCMDYDLWIRLAQETEFHFIDHPIAASRLHADTKTLGSRAAVYEEIIETARRHFGTVSPSWILGRAQFHHGDDTSFLEPPTIDANVHRRALVDLARSNWRTPRFVTRELTRGAGRSWMREAAPRRDARAGSGTPS